MTISDDERRDDGGDAQHQRPRVVPGARKDTMMRVDYRRVFPEAAQAMGGLEQAVRDSSPHSREPVAPGHPAGG
ncbi:MAG TPA: hypothetical protein VFC30_03330 [Solirubrobacteraceae bacterium]|nr:hypothetical protein [Solirubrobacteraceae bacterium]